LKYEQLPVLEADDFGRKDFFGNVEIQDFLYPVNKQFHINRIEDHIDLIKSPMPTHRKSVFVFIFFTGGSCSRSKGLDQYDITENTFFFLPPYQTTSRKHQTENSRGFYCQFNADIFNKGYYQKEILKQFTFLDFSGNPLVKVPQQKLISFLNILYRLEEIYNNTDKLNLNLAGAYLFTLFTELNFYVDNGHKAVDNAAEKLTAAYKSRLMQNIKSVQRVGDYASLLSVTPDYLNRCVKIVTGKTSHQLLDDMLLLEAKVLLNQTSLNISEVAYRIGKENVSDFIRFFKLKTGTTPKHYRQS
jgi:AraC family transcriptional activator of pobA